LQGIFRVAASGSRVKKLKAAFDANVVDMEDYKHDVHCVASKRSWKLLMISNNCCSFLAAVTLFLLKLLIIFSIKLIANNL
jgi:hypothetical protein